MEEEKKSNIKYEVHFGVHIPEVQKAYTKEELENDPETCAYLVEIGSQAVTKLKTI